MPNRKRKHHHKAPVVVRDEHQIENAVEKMERDYCPECGGTKAARGIVTLDTASDSNIALCKNPWHDRA